MQYRVRGGSFQNQVHSKQFAPHAFKGTNRDVGIIFINLLTYISEFEMEKKNVSLAY